MPSLPNQQISLHQMQSEGIAQQLASSFLPDSGRFLLFSCSCPIFSQLPSPIPGRCRFPFKEKAKSNINECKNYFIDQNWFATKFKLRTAFQNCNCTKKKKVVGGAISLVIEKDLMSLCRSQTQVILQEASLCKTTF